jgi:hypothetical protein
MSSMLIVRLVASVAWKGDECDLECDKFAEAYADKTVK